MLVDALCQFCTTLQLNDADVRDSDQLTSYALSVSVTASQLKRADRGSYEPLCQAFAEALTVTIADDGDIPIVDIALGQLQPEFDHGLEQVMKYADGVSFTITLKIDKERLLSARGWDNGPYHAIFLFFEQRLDALLTADVTTQDTELFAAPARPTLIVISKASYLFKGAMLVICGEDDVFQEAPSTPDATLESQLRRYHALTQASLNWSGFQFRSATPLHYRGVWHREGPENIRRALARSLLYLFILYTANRSSRNAKHLFEATYSNSERTFSIHLSDDMPNTAQNTALAALAKWPVDNEGTDRLTIVRSIVARSRDLGDALENYNLFLSSLPHYWQEARWQYQAFVDGKIDKHFAEVDKVADETATISQRLADSIDGITKGLSDTLLTTIGAVVASLLAALLAEKTPGAVFEIAMKAYALYLVFLAAYRLGSVGHGYLLLNAETETRLSLYRQQLGVDRVATISAPLRRRRRQFTGWFWATAGLYVALAVTIWIASGQVPREFGRLRIIAPVTPTVNPLVTPTPTHAPATYPRRFGPK